MMIDQIIFHFLLPVQVQLPICFNLDKGDVNYDTVFDAKIDINENGWSLEIFIPYSAIRFPKKEVQNWGLNGVRDRMEPLLIKGYLNTMNMGLLKNIKNIEPPTRLFFYPYLQSSVNSRKGTSPSASYSAGLDLKYGLNNSFNYDINPRFRSNIL